MSTSSRGYDPSEETGTMRNWFPTRFENSHDEYAEDIQLWEKWEKPFNPKE